MIDTLSMSATDNLPIIASPTVPAKQLIMLDAGNFASAEGDAPTIMTSKEAVVHMEDTTPLNIGTVDHRQPLPPRRVQLGKPTVSRSG